MNFCVCGHPSTSHRKRGDRPRGACRRCECPEDASVMAVYVERTLRGDDALYLSLAQRDLDDE